MTTTSTSTAAGFSGPPFTYSYPPTSGTELVVIVTPSPTGGQPTSTTTIYVGVDSNHTPFTQTMPPPNHSGDPQTIIVGTQNPVPTTPVPQVQLLQPALHLPHPHRSPRGSLVILAKTVPVMTRRMSLPRTEPSMWLSATPITTTMMSTAPWSPHSMIA